MRDFARTLLDSEASTAGSLLLAREQLRPTEKFDALYTRLFLPLHTNVADLVADIRNEDRGRRDQVLRAHAILGQALAFAVAREALLRRLGVPALSEQDVAYIAEMVGDMAIAACPCARHAARLLRRQHRPIRQRQGRLRVQNASQHQFQFGPPAPLAGPTGWRDRLPAAVRRALGHLEAEVAVRRLGDHAPQQGIERHRHGAQFRDGDALLPHGVAHTLFGHHAAGQAKAQVGRAEDQGGRQQPSRAVRHAHRDGEYHARQQRHRIHRVDDEDGRPAFGNGRQWPEKLRAVDRERVQHRMGHQHQP
ncbi:hypothetical protein G6F65_016304 [Rhizopus arrhizus]|nr:hypothetical protein G6F65_016304 [Rhizopus arrhizus]